MTPLEGKYFMELLMIVRRQIVKCSFGENKEQIEEICLKDKITDAWAPLC